MILEYELNREWLYETQEVLDEGGDPTHQKSFVVDAKFMYDYFEKNLSGEYDDINDFLQVYEPEEDGEAIYLAAKEAGALICEAITKADGEFISCTCKGYKEYTKKE